SRRNSHDSKMAGTSPAICERKPTRPRADADLRALIKHRHGAAVLRPARDVVTHRYRPFLAVGDGVHALRHHAARDEIRLHGLRAPGAERDIVFACAAFVGVTFDGE